MRHERSSNKPFVILREAISSFRQGLLHCAHLHLGCPQGQVVPEQLHDEGAVLVAVLAQGVQVRNGLVKGLAGFQ